MNKFYYLIIIIALFGCTQREDISSIQTFTREDFKEMKVLKAEERIKLEAALNPLYCYVLRDSLVLVGNRGDAQLYKAGLYSLKSQTLIRELAPKGEGPEEFLSCSLDVRDCHSDIFYLEDVIQNKYWECSIDSILSGGDYLLRSFTYSRDVIRLCPLNNEYVGYNFWHLDGNKYNKGIPTLAKYPMTYDAKGRLGSGYDYFVANVTGGYVFSDHTQKHFYVPHFFSDNINIYNDSLRLVKQLKGPDFIMPQYETIEREHNYVLFKKGTSYRGYLAYTLTPKHIYLVYEGTNGTPYKTNDLKPVEIFKLDWDGNLLADYQLDKHAIAISISQAEDTLYACCLNSYKGEVELWKYNMK